MNIQKDDYEDGLSPILSSNAMEPNFLKGKGVIEEGSLNSYENLTVLNESKSDKEEPTNISNHLSKIIIENENVCNNCGTKEILNTAQERNQEKKESSKKVKIGGFIDLEIGKQMDLLICDNFKSRYESTIHPNILKNTSHCFSTKQLNILQKSICMSNNHKIYLLYGNIAYSMVSYDKALKFYQTGINTLKEDNNESPNSLNIVILRSLLRNNLAK